MSEPRKTMKPILEEKEEKKEDLPKPHIELQNDPKNLPVNPLSPEERYLKRKIEVTERDHEEFLAYLEAKRASEEEKRAQQTNPEQAERAPSGPAQVATSKLNRRSFLTVVAGTAAVGEAAAL